MDGMQVVPVSRRAVPGVVRACTRVWLVPLLLGPACTAEITGGIEPPSEAESRAFAGAPASASSPVAGMGGASADHSARGVSHAGASAGSTADDASIDSGSSRAMMLAAEGGAGASAPMASGSRPSMTDADMGAAAGVGGDSDAPQTGAGGHGQDEPSDQPSQPGDDGSVPGDSQEGAEPGVAGEIVPGGVRWLGRVDDRDPNAARFSWAGSGFAAVVKGPTVAVRLTSQGSTVYYQSVIDGELGERFEVKTGDHIVTLASGLSDGPHTFEVYRDTEGDGPVSVFGGFDQGELMGAPRPSGRFFEVVGDSISAGYGSLGSERHGSNAGPGCGANPSNSSWFHTYSAVAARALDAEVSTLARSGFGMVRGYGQNMNVMPPLFDDTLAGSNNPLWDFAHEPQAVIINLGTNDWNGGDPGTAYEKAYIDFVAEVRDRYPDAWILLTVGSSLEPEGARQCLVRLGHIVAARMQAGDDKIDSFDIGLQDASMTGCGWHPNAAEHARMGMVLADELRRRLGWQ